MWEDVNEGDTNVEWVRDALMNCTFIGVTDVSYNREKAKSVCSTGWIIACQYRGRRSEGLEYYLGYLRTTTNTPSRFMAEP
jgi:hypothetical protein